MEKQKGQSATQNPWPAAHLQVAPGFRIRRAIDATAEENIGIPDMDDSLHFCLIYHFKVVCKFDCGGRHYHRTTTQSETGRMTEWKNRFCLEDAPPPVTTVKTDHYGGGDIVAGSVSSQSCQSLGGQGRQS